MVVDTRPLITLSGQRIGWERAITHFLVLGQTGSGKSLSLKQSLLTLPIKQHICQLRKERCWLLVTLNQRIGYLLKILLTVSLEMIHIRRLS